MRRSDVVLRETLNDINVKSGRTKNERSDTQNYRRNFV